MTNSQVECKSGARVREFLPTDVVTIRLRHWDAVDLAGADLAYLGRYFAWPPEGSWRIAWTVERRKDGAVVACGGVVPIPGASMGELWALSSDLTPLYAKTCVRLTRRVLAQAFHRGLARIHTLILPENAAAVRYIEALGFQREGLLRRCGHNGLDRYIYARITA